MTALFVVALFVQMILGVLMCCYAIERMWDERERRP